MDATEVHHDPDENRYEITRDGEVVGFAAYYLEHGRVVFSHTEIAPTVEGQGLGSALVRAALDDVRARQLRIVPLCPFVAAQVRRHAEYSDLVVAPDGSQMWGAS